MGNKSTSIPRICLETLDDWSRLCFSLSSQSCFPLIFLHDSIYSSSLFNSLARPLTLIQSCVRWDFRNDLDKPKFAGESIQLVLCIDLGLTEQQQLAIWDGNPLQMPPNPCFFPTISCSWLDLSRFVCKTNIFITYKIWRFIDMKVECTDKRWQQTCS